MALNEDNLDKYEAYADLAIYVMANAIFVGMTMYLLIKFFDAPSKVYVPDS